MNNYQRSENYETLISDFSEGQLQNENLLNFFPQKLTQEFAQLYQDCHDNRETENEIQAKVLKKVKIIVKFMLLRCRSKKEGFDILKNVQFINNCKGENGNKETMKTIMKLKMTKLTVEKDQLFNICNDIIVDLVMGKK